MGFRFFRRVQLLPGISLNFSKSGASISVGPRGAKITMGPRGTRTTVGIPGTGISYTQRFPTAKKASSSTRQESASEATPSVATSGSAPAPSPTTVAQPARAFGAKQLTPQTTTAAGKTSQIEDRLTLDFLERLVTSDDEELFIDGCREYVRGDAERALVHLSKALHIADAAYLAGVLAVRTRRFEDAERFWKTALERPADLGKHFAKYGLHIEMVLPITDEITAHLEPNSYAILLGLAEIFQERKCFDDAISCLEQAQTLHPDDVVTKLSLVELLSTTYPDDTKTCQKIVEASEGVACESFLHTGVLLYKAKALRKLGLLDAALATTKEVLRHTKDCSPEFVHALRYEHALVLEARGEAQAARREFELLYAEVPNYEDLAKRLGL